MKRVSAQAALGDKNLRNKPLLAILAVLCASCGDSSSSFPRTPDARILFELREKCGNDAQEWFKLEYGAGGPWKSEPGDDESSDYVDHYSEALNRCFAATTTIGISHATEKPVGLITRHLFDVNENRQLGGFSKYSDNPNPSRCNVGQKKCASDSEWNGLAAFYMEK